ncbi:MAG: tRNA uridine-5-carboxymethylaminomethyl(34) synthesis GTPase MnmE [Rickettsiales bacterium]|jgi:tRNA modification GTPase|nr:tRNA uridine-5-carboxymethylaminomethyl(34) synthesis GTPase MnmE [Rickettsiales bacterium]
MSDTIFAPLTLEGRCSVYLLRISGSRVLQCLRAFGIRKKLEHRMATLCTLRRRDGSELDETLCVFFQGPRSFTGEDVCEIGLHCSSHIITEVISILYSLDGVRLAENGEFSKRAFLNGKLDLVQAEAVADLVDSRTELQHRRAMRQFRGENSAVFETLRKKIIYISSILEVFLDFPEENIGSDIIEHAETKIKDLIDELSVMLANGNAGLKIKNGLAISIVGKPNVGKSSLLNFLAKDDVAIVSARAGTTRDILHVSGNISGIPVKFFDTAGIGESSDEIELEGIRRALANANNADFRILLLEPENYVVEPRIASLVDENTILVLNKIDLLDEDPRGQEKLKQIESEYPDIIKISLKYRRNCEILLDRLTDLVNRDVISFLDTDVITRERHRKELTEAMDNLRKIDLKSTPLEITLEYVRRASFSLGRITGKIDVNEILDSIFENFCIGK